MTLVLYVLQNSWQTCSDHSHILIVIYEGLPIQQIQKRIVLNIHTYDYECFGNKACRSKNLEPRP